MTDNYVDYYLVRHGQSIGNIRPAAHKEYGDALLPLTTLGTLQAAYSANFLHNLLLEKKQNSEKNQEIRILLLHSPYERAWHTTDFMDTALGDDFDFLLREQHEGLREQDYGIWDGLKDEEYALVSPNESKEYFKLWEQGLGLYATTANGEAPIDLWSRIKSEVLPSTYRMIKQYDINTVIMVSHGVTIRGTIAALVKPNMPLHKYYAQFKNPPNASVHLISGNQNHEIVQHGRMRSGKYQYKGMIYNPNDYIPEILNSFTPEALEQPERRLSTMFEAAVPSF